MTTALLLSGTGRYADPWHPFEETSDAVAGLLKARGLQVTTADDVDTALAGLRDPGAWPDLLVVNVGLPRDGGTSPGTAEASAGLDAWLTGGRPLLGLHSSSTSFVESEAWEAALGGRWVRGVSMHPEYGKANILLEGSFPVGVPDFTVDDERYSWLRTSPDVVVHARHEHEGHLHPLMWSLQRPVRADAGSGAGVARSFYDALGHDAASYSSPEHRELLVRAVDWLLA
ncbi:ThuA domain-containing protein [Arthrobacter sp. JZ12]|uniref:ThuA domain-containing protein n=1 Tax=Arthrobacter sp. JZ12 TaxID=2654190 RepID=UPI002B4991C2|nr:ThuA domain-containing protein [Arthrobacter sp. JZ12]WRH23896.1 ThuA domain-containing protein [Arthrobacter sp. JZ12]